MWDAQAGAVGGVRAPGRGGTGGLSGLLAPFPGCAQCCCRAQVPSALLSLAWDAAVMADVEAAAEEQRSPLRPELLARAQPLS